MTAMLSLMLLASIDSSSPQHLVAGIIGGVITYHMTESRWATVALGAAAGIAKESYDQANGGFFDWDDVGFDILGAWIGAQGTHARLHRNGISFTWRFQ